ncbi:hypothetical protein AAFC00_002803 [Neodothiora populina]
MTAKDVAARLPPEQESFAGAITAMGTRQLINTLKTLVANHDTNRGAPMMRVIWILLAISTIVIFCRLLVKWRTMRRIFYDDALIVAALIFGYLQAIFVTLSYENGLGRHLVFLSSHQREYAMRIGFISLAWGFLSPMFGRMSFCISLMFIAGTDPHIKKWTIYVFIALQILVNLGSVITMYSQCGTHLNVLFFTNDWDQVQGYCWDPSVQANYNYFAGSINTITDIYLTILPGIMIIHTNIPLRQKIGLALLLCLSSVAMVASIVKTYESKSLNQIVDYTYDLVPYAIWISVELNIVMTVASIPITRPLFTSFIRYIRGTIAKHGSVHEKFVESISLGSVISQKRPRTNAKHIPTSSSQEHIKPQEDPFAITHTVEVEVTTVNNEVSFVHAALVGLVEDNAHVTNVWH